MPDSDGTEANSQKRPANCWEKATVVILAFTLGAAGYAGYEAARLAGLTEQLVTDTKDTAKKQLRAYVYAIPFASIDSVDVGRYPETLVRFRNSGQTPAFEVSSLAEWRPLVYPLVENTDLSIPRPLKIRFPEILLNPGTEPNAAATFRMREPLSSADREQLKTGENKRFYVWGVVTYRDIYDEWHFTEYCFSYYGAGDRLNHMEYCPVHNGAGDGKPELGKPTSDPLRMISPGIAASISGIQITPR